MFNGKNMNVGVWILILTLLVGRQLTAIFWGFIFPISNGSNDIQFIEEWEDKLNVDKASSPGPVTWQVLNKWELSWWQLWSWLFPVFFSFSCLFFFSLYVFNIFPVGSLLIQSSFLLTCISPHKPLISYSPSSPASSVDQHSHPFQQVPPHLSP